MMVRFSSQMAVRGQKQKRLQTQTSLALTSRMDMKMKNAHRLLWNIGVGFLPDRAGRYYRSPRRWFVTHRYMPST